MKHYDEYIIQLIQLYLVGDLSGEEKVKLEEWVSQDPSREKLFKEICNEKSVASDFGIYEKVNKDSAWEKVILKGNIKQKNNARRLGWYKFVAAVMIPLMVVAVGYFIRETKQGIEPKDTEFASIEPGKSKAILRLADNRVIEITREQETRFDVAEGLRLPITCQEWFTRSRWQWGRRNITCWKFLVEVNTRLPCLTGRLFT